MLMDFSPEASPFTAKERAVEADAKRSEGFTVIGVKLIAAAELVDAEGERFEVRTDVEPYDWFLAADDFGDSDSARLCGPDKDLFIRQARQGLSEAVELLTKHFARQGFIRGDGFWRQASKDQDDCAGTDEELTPIFWAVTRASDGVELENLAHVRTDLGKRGHLSNVTLETQVSSHFFPARVFDQLRETAGPFQLLCFDEETSTTDLQPVEGESCGDWLERVAIAPDDLARLNERWERSGRDIELFAMCGNATERAAGGAGVKWVVPGLLPRGVVTLLVGAKGSGKSTLVSELTAKLESDLDISRRFLGIDLTGEFLTATFTAEDSDAIHAEREKFFRHAYGDLKGFIIDCARYSFAQCLEMIRRLPSIDLVIFDPARAFLVGDEDSSDAVNRFYSELVAVAREKNCAVLVIHHLKKGPPPKRLADVDAAVRGSGVHMDRARVVIGIIHHPNGTIEVGIIKHNIPHSSPMLAPVNEGLLFSRNPAALTLEPLGEANGASAATVADDAIADIDSKVCSAIEAMAENGTVVRKTGSSSLFKLQPRAVKGLARSMIERSVARLIATGRITDTEDGLAPASKHFQ